MNLIEWQKEIVFQRIKIGIIGTGAADPVWAHDLRTFRVKKKHKDTSKEQ